jgi:hypothetical protein
MVPSVVVLGVMLTLPSSVVFATMKSLGSLPKRWVTRSKLYTCTRRGGLPPARTRLLAASPDLSADGRGIRASVDVG